MPNKIEMVSPGKTVGFYDEDQVKYLESKGWKKATVKAPKGKPKTSKVEETESGNDTR